MGRTNRSPAGRRWTAALVAGGTALAVAAAILVLRDDDRATADAPVGEPVAADSPIAATPAPTRPSPSVDRARVDPPAARRPRVRIPEQASGRFAVAAGRSPEVGRGRPVRYTVAVERGLPYLPSDVAPFVDATLADARGWTKGGRHAFQRVPRRPDVKVLLASPVTTDELCAPLLTRGRVSCRNGARVVLNARRWAYGIPDYDGDLRRYRQYVVNHEVGHVLGAGHVPCPGRGRLAPLMQQQSYGLDGCRPNPWPR